MSATQPSLPLARPNDPDTSRAAARKVRVGNEALVAAIRKVLIVYGPQSAWEIAYAVEDAHGDRWALDTIRTAIARVEGLERHHWDSVSPRGNRCVTYCLPTTQVHVRSDLL